MPVISVAKHNHNVNGGVLARVLSNALPLHKIHHWTRMPGSYLPHTNHYIMAYFNLIIGHYDKISPPPPQIFSTLVLVL